MTTDKNETTTTKTISGGTLTVTQKEKPYNESQNYGAFAAIKADGSVITWGSNKYGGDSSTVAKDLDGSIDVVQIYSNKYAFAALRADGSVVTWGDYVSISTVASKLTGNVTHIYSTYAAFAALKLDGSVVTWGRGWGGDSSDVLSQLNGVTDVEQIYSAGTAFAALRSDGSVVTWGGIAGGDSSKVANQIDGSVDVVQIYSNDDNGAGAANRQAHVISNRPLPLLQLPPSLLR